ncbi:hypothetical protein [Pleurocapsa sp. CCALA 161]|uniref:hypothetical protein n=1 Tax=Pleurocapsa sp. CCALA 161 TaxID=2107688 RepID=UPI0018EDFEE4|nr:hypothetical protein [Pleurocapsa sp. CCALA 161]
MNDWLVEDFPDSTQVSTTEKRLGSAYASRSHLSRILRNPFSLVWSKLAALFKAAKTSSKSEVAKNSQSEQQERESIREQYLDTCFTDRVDPSLYYILFLSQPQLNCRANSYRFRKLE